MNNEEFELLGEPRMTMAQFTIEEQLYGLEESDEPSDRSPSTKMHLADTPRPDHWRFITIQKHNGGTVTAYIAEWEYNQSGENFCLRSHNYEDINEWSFDRLSKTLRLGDYVSRPENIKFDINFYNTVVMTVINVAGRLD